MNVQNLRGKLLLSLLLGIVVFAGLSFYADFSDLLTSLEDFNWALLPLILGLTSVNYVLRFVKWEYYLRLIGVRGLAKRDSLLIYLSGLGMVITPGKVGEWLKCYLLREVHGTPIVRSAPIIIAERLADSIALVIIASAGVLVFGNFWQVFVAVALGCLLFIVVVRHRPTATGLLRVAHRMPVLGRFAPQLEEFYESTYVLLSPTAVLAMVALSTISWFSEVLAFYVTLLGLGLEGNGELLLESAFILPIATLASAVLLTPGGLGVAEASITGLSVALLDLSRSSAAVGTLIIRFGTLWFGVIVGLIAFAILSRRLSLDAVATAEPGPDLAVEPLTPPAQPVAGAESMPDAS
ncbi:MAG: lysylphosphatidylglycerol synthase transmembrane domain-containing protein [Dehalococcoidia bacterium]